MHNPTEHVQEHVTHEAAHGGHGGQPGWITAAALTAAFLAALAAVTGALATKHLTESTQKRIDSSKERISANDNWNFYQSKSIKSSIIDSRLMEYNLTDPARITDAVKKQHDDDLDKKKEYATKPEEDDKNDPKGLRGIQAKALGYEAQSKALEAVSEQHLTTHETFEMSATMFHIAIAVVAISVVAKRKEFWGMSMVGGAVGLYFFGTALAHAPAHDAAHHEGTAEQHAPATPGAGHAPAPAAEHATPAAGAEHAATPAGGEKAPAAEHAPAAGH